MASFQRKSTYPIQPLILSRVSLRALSEERIPEEVLMSLFEAARWAPSSYNNQPWRYLYARRGEKAWDAMFRSLVDWNKTWCATADTLVLVLSRNNFEHNGKTSATAQFDTGASWMNLAMEAHSRNIVAHAMQGFDYDAIKKDFKISDSFTINMMIAIGLPGNPDTLPEEMKKQEVPTDRKPLGDIISRGEFSFV